MRCIILCAGKGTRLDKGHKILQRINNRCLLENTLQNLYYCGFEDSQLLFVVGYNHRKLVKHLPKDSGIVVNSDWKATNTTGSLQLALKTCPNEEIMIINGDTLADTSCYIDVFNEDGSCGLVTTDSVGAEEVKYTTDQDGYMDFIDKNVPLHVAEGEFCGISKVCAEDRAAFDLGVDKLSKTSYYDSAFSVIKTLPVYTGDRRFIEIDFEDDLETCRKMFQ